MHSRTMVMNSMNCLQQRTTAETLTHRMDRGVTQQILIHVGSIVTFRIVDVVGNF